MTNIFPESAALSAKFRVKNSVFIRPGSLTIQGQAPWNSAEANFDEFSREAYQKMEVKYPKFFKMDPVAKLSILAAHVLLSDSAAALDTEVAVVLSNKNSTLDSDLAHYQTIKDADAYFPSPAIFAYTLPNIAAGEICIRYQFKGENLFFVMEKPDWSFLVEYVEDLLAHTNTKACLFGWVDAALPDYEAAVYWMVR